MGLIRDAFRVFGKVREQQVRDKYVKCGITRRDAVKGIVRCSTAPCIARKTSFGHRLRRADPLVLSD
jgi:hypothetical protein